MSNNKFNKAFLLVLFFGYFTFISGQTIFNCPDVPKDSLSFTPTGLKYFFRKSGEGKCPKPGDRVLIDYVGRLSDNTIFSSSEETGPLFFYLGYGQLIKGFEEAIMLLSKGACARFIVPHNLAYGKKYYNQIPAHSELTFDIELLAIVEEPLINLLKLNLQEANIHPSGIKYQLIDNGNDHKPLDGSYVEIHYTCFDQNGNIFDSSVKRGKTASFNVGDGTVIPAWDLMVRTIGEGGKLTMHVPWKLGYGKKGLSPIIPPKKNLFFNIELVLVRDEIQVIPYSFKGIDSLILGNGLKCIWIEKGNGSGIDSSSVVKVHYNGYFSNGTLFDSSVKKNKPIAIPMNSNMIIQGWEITLMQCSVGDKIKLFVPWRLAYGKKGNKPQIPPKTDLIFDIEILEVF